MDSARKNMIKAAQSVGVVAALIGALGMLTACNILAPAYVLVHGPEKTPGLYKLEKARPTVVFVDDRANVLSKRVLRQQIAVAAQNTLLKEGVLTNVIEASAAMTAAAHEPSGQPLDIVSLGRAVQAEVVIYVTVDAFGLSPDGNTYAPTAGYHVKVLDITKPAPRLWPTEREGHPLTVNINEGAAALPKSASDQVAALNNLADRSGLEVAQLFFDHETHESIRQGH